jgi:hypothetical protein
MTKIDRTPQKIVLQSGSTTLELDKQTGKATMKRKMLMFNLKPVERPLSEIVDITLDAGVDRASGIEVCNAMVVGSDGAAWAFPGSDKKDTQAAIQTMREFLGLKG